LRAWSAQKAGPKALVKHRDYQQNQSQEKTKKHAELSA
jgi:hypothetical protein